MKIYNKVVRDRILELMPTAAELADIAYNQIGSLAAADQKRAERGGFARGVVLVSTE
ncbi:MAG: hypothetical protein WCP79_12220 [Bacillota bacterium]